MAIKNRIQKLEKKFRKIFCLILLIGFHGWGTNVLAQEDTLASGRKIAGDGYREGQYPGLGRAASQIFYSDNWITFSF